MGSSQSVLAMEKSTQCRLGASKFGEARQLEGDLSCFQTFKQALPPAVMHAMKDCPLVEHKDPCPEEYVLFKNMCYKVEGCVHILKSSNGKPLLHPSGWLVPLDIFCC